MVTLDEIVLRGLSLSPSSADPGFYRLCPSEISPRVIPLLKIPDAREPDWAAQWHLSRSVVHHLGCYVVTDIVVAGEGYLFADGMPIYQSDVVVPYIKEFMGRITVDNSSHLKEIDGSGPIVIAFDRGHKTYGHFLLDTLTRIFLAERMFGGLLRECQILLPHDLPSWGHSILAKVFPDLSASFRTVDLSLTGLRVRRAIIPTHCHLNYQFHPFAKYLFSDILARATSGQSGDGREHPRQLFISRSKLGACSRMCDDIEAIEQFAKSRGMFILHPEELDWEEQLAYCKAASVIVAEYGSALHNSIFSADGIIVLALNRLQFLQSFLGALNQQRLGYLLPAEAGVREGRSWYRMGVERTGAAIDTVLRLAA